MDEISKAINEKNLGIQIPETEEKVGNLLWMDDVILITEDPNELQEMLNITHDIAERYHIKFGNEKSKVMKIKYPRRNNQNQQDPQFHLGDMILEYCNQYKYLGEMMNDKSNMQDHIKEIKRKAEAAYQTILTITGNNNFANIEMEAIWKLVETCILPIITYGAETWKTTKKKWTR